MNKCHSCGYYFRNEFNSCPRCSQGFSGPIDANFIAGKSGELGKGVQSRGLQIGVFSVALIVIIAAIASSNRTPSSEDYSQTYDQSDSGYVSDSGDSDGTSDYSDWIPDGYFVLDVNSDIASDSDFVADYCENPNPYSGTGYCWTYRIVTKTDCQVVTATLDLTNDGESIGQAAGQTLYTQSGVPAILEIDAYGMENVNDSTAGNLIEMTCSN